MCAQRTDSIEIVFKGVQEAYLTNYVQSEELLRIKKDALVRLFSPERGNNEALLRPSAREFAFSQIL